VSLATLGLLEACDRVGGVPLVTWAGFFFTGGRGTKMASHHRPPPDAFPWYVRTRSAAALLRNRRVCYCRRQDSSSSDSMQLFLDDTLLPHADAALLTRGMRQRGAALARRHLRLAPGVARSVATIVGGGGFAGARLVGVHIRGTDYGTEWKEGCEQALIPLARYVAEAERALAALPPLPGGADGGADGRPRKLFVASDSEEAIAAFVAHFGAARVVHVRGMARAPRYAFNASGWRDAISTVDRERAGLLGASAELGDAARFRSGAGALVDAALLASCEALVCWDSSVARLAALLNGGMAVHALENTAPFRHCREPDDAAQPPADYDVMPDHAPVVTFGVAVHALVGHPALAAAPLAEGGGGAGGDGGRLAGQGGSLSAEEELVRELLELLARAGDLTPVVEPPASGQRGSTALPRAFWGRTPSQVLQSSATVGGWKALFDMIARLRRYAGSRLQKCECPDAAGVRERSRTPHSVLDGVLGEFIAV
jgi:hypothetical protein